MKAEVGLHPRVKGAIRAITPVALLTRYRQHVARRRAVLLARLIAATGARVQTGPFAGISYVRESCGSAAGPKILGTYESELAAVVEAIIAARFEHVIDVGAAEGYYAVGLLCRLPEARVTAFEAGAPGRALLHELAAANGVADRLDVRGYCDGPQLNAVYRPGEHTVLIVDIEGGEKQLLDPEPLPWLRRVPVLVELHDFVDPGISREVRQRFERTHEIVSLRSRQRRMAEMPPIPGLSARQLRFLADEWRPCRMEWFWMTPRDPQTGAGGMGRAQRCP